MNAALETLKNCELKVGYDSQALDIQLKSNGVNNRRDRQMVLEVLDFIFQLKDSYKKNIVRYTVNQIREREIANTFNELDEIYGIGDKKASLYLRDTILIYKLEGFLKLDQLKYCQPIDTWLRQVALRLKIIHSQEIEDEAIKSSIIQKCLEAHVSPLLFNVGAWMVGANSFELLIEKL